MKKQAIREDPFLRIACLRAWKAQSTKERVGRLLDFVLFFRRRIIKFKEIATHSIPVRNRPWYIKVR